MKRLAVPALALALVGCSGEPAHDPTPTDQPRAARPDLSAGWNEGSVEEVREDDFAAAPDKDGGEEDAGGEAEAEAGSDQSEL